MELAIAYSISGLSMAALLVLWFVNTYKVLSRKRDEVYKAEEQITLHRDGYQKELGSLEKQTARHMLDTSTQIYGQIRVAYNKTTKSPVYRFPGVFMGFRIITRQKDDPHLYRWRVPIRYRRR